MTYFFSPTKGGFYTEETHGDAMPTDVLPVSEDRHRDLMAAQENGASIVAGPTGHPQARQPVIAERRKRAVNQVRVEARRRIRAVSPEWRQMNDMRAPSAAGEARFAAIDAIRTASDIIEQRVASASAQELDALVVAECGDWPDAPKG